MKAEPLLIVIRRPLLVDASLTRARDGTVAILISDTLPESELAAALWHEVVHLLRTAGGYDQSEAAVEEAAQALAAACPDIVAWVGLAASDASPGR